MFCLLIAICALLTIFARHTEHPISALLRSTGYPYEEDQVITADGFILGVTRIPPSRPNAPAVILQHGLVDSGATWLLNQPHQSLGFILSRAGYDVWMGNSRGNTYSKGHTELTTDDAEYWNSIDFSAMAQYDLPALVDHVLTRTGQKSVLYVGHSQGTTQMFAALAENYGQLKSKISLFIALSPVAYVRYITSVPIKMMADLDMDRIIRLTGQKGFLPNEDFYSRLGFACEYMSEACKLVPLVFCGADLRNMNTSRFGFYLEYTAAGTSTHNMCHWAQHVRNARFGLYDWGPLRNLQRYHRLSPPEYNLSAITTPLAMFTGGADTLSERRDIDLLTSRLRSIVFTNAQPNYGHLDFVWGLNAHEKIYPDVVRLLRQYGRSPDGAARATE